ncbi:unnamed protein product, partial [marine sediment metagenome]
AYTSRYIIPWSKLLYVPSLFNIEFGYHSGTYHIQECWVGNSPNGELWDFDGDQVQVKVSYQSSWFVSEPGVESDTVHLELKSGKDFVISIYVTDNNDFPLGSTPALGYSGFYKGGNTSSDTAPDAYDPWLQTGKQCIIEHIYQPLPYYLQGTVKQKGVPVERTVRSYIRSNGLLYDTTQSLTDGSFQLNAPNDTTEMFVIAFDDAPGEQYNSLIYDRVKGFTL